MNAPCVCFHRLRIPIRSIKSPFFTHRKFFRTASAKAFDIRTIPYHFVKRDLAVQSDEPQFNYRERSDQCPDSRCFTQRLQANCEGTHRAMRLQLDSCQIITTSISAERRTLFVSCRTCSIVCRTIQHMVVRQRYFTRTVR